MQKFKPQGCVEFFATNPPYLLHVLGAFHSVWLHLGPFRYYMKLGAKWVEVVQLIHKFVPRSRVRICRNECTRSTPLDPKLMFCFVSYCLGAFGSILLLYDTRFKTGQTVVINAKVHATKLH